LLPGKLVWIMRVQMFNILKYMVPILVWGLMLKFFVY